SRDSLPCRVTSRRCHPCPQTEQGRQARGQRRQPVRDATKNLRAHEGGEGCPRHPRQQHATGSSNDNTDISPARAGDADTAQQYVLKQREEKHEPGMKCVEAKAKAEYVKYMDGGSGGVTKLVGWLGWLVGCVGSPDGWKPSRLIVGGALPASP